MTAREEGFLLLTGYLGDPGRKPLTLPQLRTLTLRVRNMERPDPDAELTKEDLLRIGCSSTLAERVPQLLSQGEQLQWYLQQAKKAGCYPITRIGPDYPGCLHAVLGPEAPGALWAKGDAQLLKGPLISLVGSRDLEEPNRKFAYEVGKQAAAQGYTLVSGNARGADRTAQDACLAHGGKVISIVADALEHCRERDRVLYLSEAGFELPFSTHRALQRNRIIHAMGEKVFVAQCRLGIGGTWSGTEWNLRRSLRPVFCFADGSDAATELTQLGAQPIAREDLSDIQSLVPPCIQFL